MLPAICRTLPIGHELRGCHTDLVGDESQHRCGRCLGGIEHAARKAHAAHEHGKPEPIGRRPLLGDEVKIGPGDPVQQENQLKYASLVANTIMLSNCADMTGVLTSMAEDKRPVTPGLVA
jgi:hypothetical protein